MVYGVRLHRRAFAFACVLGLLVILVARVPTLTAFFSPPVSSDAKSAAHTALGSVHIYPSRVRVLGYQREQFGSGWAMTVADDGDYVDTRELVIRGSVPGLDEYSGEQLVASDIEIDHVVPLAAAWDMGAWAWDAAKRRRFANDSKFNLIATAAKINREKSDHTLAEWMPPDRSRHCWYAARFLQVCATYGLGVAERDAEAARKACQL